MADDVSGQTKSLLRLNIIIRLDLERPQTKKREGRIAVVSLLRNIRKKKKNRNGPDMMLCDAIETFCYFWWFRIGQN